MYFLLRSFCLLPFRYFSIDWFAKYRLASVGTLILDWIATLLNVGIARLPLVMRSHISD
jgi:hypothetical protein